MGVLRTECPLEAGSVLVAKRFFNTGVGSKGLGAGEAAAKRALERRTEAKVNCMMIRYLICLVQLLERFHHDSSADLCGHIYCSICCPR